MYRVLILYGLHIEKRPKIVYYKDKGFTLNYNESCTLHYEVNPVCIRYGGGMYV